MFEKMIRRMIIEAFQDLVDNAASDGGEFRKYSFFEMAGYSAKTKIRRSLDKIIFKQIESELKKESYWNKNSVEQAVIKLITEEQFIDDLVEKINRKQLK